MEERATFSSNGGGGGGGGGAFLLNMGERGG